MSPTLAIPLEQQIQSEQAIARRFVALAYCFSFTNRPVFISLRTDVDSSGHMKKSNKLVSSAAKQADQMVPNGPIGARSLERVDGYEPD